MIKLISLITLLFSINSFAFDAEYQVMLDDMEARQKAENKRNFNDSTGWEERRKDKINNEYNSGNNLYNFIPNKHPLRVCMGIKLITGSILNCERI